MRLAAGVTVAAMIAAAAAYAISPRTTPPLQPTHIPLAHMQLNTLARSTAGVVAGGELGHIFVSADQGAHWQPAALSADRNALINQIVFADGKLGIAVGHEGWILRTEDGGLHWREVAFRSKGGDPLMSVAHVGAKRWIAVGAFGQAMQSNDDGNSWQRFEIAGVGDHHLNRIVGTADERHWIIVGERGLVLLSDDAGEHWCSVAPFYNGSFYGAVPLKDSGWLVYGMRGNAFRSTDGGSTWIRADVPTPASMFADTRTADGALLLAGQGGIVLESHDDGQHFTLIRNGVRVTFMDLRRVPDGWLIASDGGLRRYPADLHVAAVPARTASASSTSAPSSTSGATR